VHKNIDRLTEQLK